ncbi:MAG: ferredoxin--NADP reductase [Limisphaerales bacterium]|jgi:ferredoxin-NADP reductase
MPRAAAEMLVEEVTMELPDVKLIRLKWPEGYAPEFQTGQFITLNWPDTPSYKRAYSICSCALDHGYFEIAVKREGKMGTRLVDWAKAGDRLQVLPPAGKFLPALEPGKHLICLAGGSGVTPFRAFAREATRRQLDTRLTILYSVRTPGDIIFKNEFLRLEDENPHVRFQVTCTRLAPADPWPGRRGRIDAAWIQSHVADLKSTVFYACGPTAFVETVEQMVVHDLGASKNQMKTEKWG